MSDCDHKFIDSTRCLKCGKGYAELKLDSQLALLRELWPKVSAGGDAARDVCNAVDQLRVELAARDEELRVSKLTIESLECAESRLTSRVADLESQLDSERTAHQTCHELASRLQTRLDAVEREYRFQEEVYAEAVRALGVEAPGLGRVRSFLDMWRATLAASVKEKT